MQSTLTGDRTVSETPAVPAAIVVDEVTLSRRTQQELHYDLKRSVLRLLAGHIARVQRRTVLKNVSLRIERGEKVGIIGPNGSGKSTLLKIIAGILMPSRGTVSVDGTIAPLIELGVGFDLDLSLVDNILYYGVLLGHSEDAVRAHADEILDFAELSEYREEPTKTLSSGMAARLSFAIATEFRPDILLVDEVLSVGDERFRRKCAARIDRFWDEQSTILLVSHDMLTVGRTCDRVIWLAGGEVHLTAPRSGPLKCTSRRSRRWRIFGAAKISSSSPKRTPEGRFSCEARQDTRNCSSFATAVVTSSPLANGATRTSIRATTSSSSRTTSSTRFPRAIS